MIGAWWDTTHLTYVMRNRGDDPDTVYYLPIEMPIIVGVDESEIMPLEFALLRAYPNPFNARTTIEFALAEPGDAELTIYDITGAKVETIRRPGLEAGKHSVVWDAADVASGVYFARLEAGRESWKSDADHKAYFITGDIFRRAAGISRGFAKPS
jgi:hypothetical protein